MADSLDYHATGIRFGFYPLETTAVPNAGALDEITQQRVMTATSKCNTFQNSRHVAGRLGYKLRRGLLHGGVIIG